MCQEYLAATQNEGRFQVALTPVSSAVFVAECQWISSRLLQGLVPATSLAAGSMSCLRATLEALSEKLRWME